MPENPSIILAVRPSMLRGRESIMLPPIDISFYAPIGSVLVAGTLQDGVITEYLRALVAALPDPADGTWERAPVGFKIKRAKRKTRDIFAAHPAIIERIVALLGQAKRLQNEFRNVVAHGQFVTSFPKEGKAYLEIHYSSGGVIRKYEYTAAEIEQAFHDMLAFATEIQECFDPKISDPGLSSSDKEELSAFLAKHHPRGSILPTNLARPK